MKLMLGYDILHLTITNYKYSCPCALLIKHYAMKAYGGVVV
jgi:hypothetical protein